MRKHNVRTLQARTTLIMLGMSLPLLRAANRYVESQKDKMKGKDAVETKALRESAIQEVGAMLHDRAFRSENLDHFRRRLYALGAYNRSKRVPGTLEAPVSRLIVGSG